MTRTGTGPGVRFPRESVTGERRVTIDIDDADALDVVRTWHNLRAAGGYDIEARVSQSGEGFHVRAWFREGDVDALDVETMRLTFGDHARRTWMDREHTSKPQQVLFTGASEWVGDPFVAADEKRQIGGLKP